MVRVVIDFSANTIEFCRNNRTLGLVLLLLLLLRCLVMVVMVVMVYCFVSTA